MEKLKKALKKNKHIYLNAIEGFGSLFDEVFNKNIVQRNIGMEGNVYWKRRTV